MIIPSTIDTRNEAIGMNLVPPKKPSTAGILIVWNLLYSHATVPPTIIPPNTDVCIEVIPKFLPTTDVGTSEYHKMS